MADLLKINGVPFPVASDSLEESIREIGLLSQAFSGKLRRSRQTIKKDLRATTTPLILSEARAWEGMVQGLGQAWQFTTHLYSASGLGPTAVTGTPTISGSKLSLDTGEDVDYSVDDSLGWTVMGEVYNGTTTKHYVVTSGGHKWVDGVRDDGATTTFFAVSSGVLTLAASGATFTFSGVVFFPFVTPDSWPPYLYTAFPNEPVPNLPTIILSGDSVPETSRDAIGTVESAPLLYAEAGYRQTLTVLLQGV